MKRHLPFLILLSVLLSVAGGVATMYPQTMYPQPVPQLAPLDQLEARTRTLPAMAQVYSAPTDNMFSAQTVRLETVVQFVLGVQVNYIDIGDPDLYGWTNTNPRKPRAVNISKSLKQTARLEILSHEAGHRLQPPTIEATVDSEAFAEAVSFLVCRAAGHDTLEKASVYLAVHKGGLHVLKDYRIDIEYAAMVLSGGMPAR